MMAWEILVLQLLCGDCFLVVAPTYYCRDYLVPLVNVVAISDSSIDRRRHRDFAVRKLRVVAETFFSQTDISDKKHVDLIVKVLNGSSLCLYYVLSDETIYFIVVSQMI